MKKFIRISFTALLALFLITGCSKTNIPKVDKAKNQIDYWKQKITVTKNEAKVFYHLYSGENYKNDKWVTEKPAENDESFIGEEINFWTDSKMGSYFEMQSSSPSGDWSIFTKNYYGLNKKLEFVFWTMNTTQAQSDALTIERKFTFDKSGILKQKCESVFQMDSGKPVENPNYMEHDVKYWKTVSDLPFASLIKTQ